MGKAIISGGAVMTAPSAGTPLSEVAEGSVVKLNENGSSVEFYVAKHDYESGLNGAGRTLLVRKDCYDERAWDSSGVNAYASSDIDSWLNSDYKALLDAGIQSATGTTKFYYTPGNGNTNVTTLVRAIFLLSLTELGKSVSSANTEGSALSIASALRTVYFNGSEANQWTRSPNKTSIGKVYFVFGDTCFDGGCAIADGCRPCFTLPATAQVQADGTIKI